MLADRTGLELTVSELLSLLSGRRDETDRAAVLGNGCLPERVNQTVIGPVSVKVPKIRCRDRKPVRFRSALVTSIAGKTVGLRATRP